MYFSRSKSRVCTIFDIKSGLRLKQDMDVGTVGNLHKCFTTINANLNDMGYGLKQVV